MRGARGRRRVVGRAVQRGGGGGRRGRVAGAGGALGRLGGGVVETQPTMLVAQARG